MIIRIGEKKHKLDNCINLFIAGIFLLPLYIDLFGTLSAVLGFSTTITTYIYYAVLWGLLLLSIPMIRRRINRTVLIAMAIIIAAMLLHYLIYPESRDYVLGTDPFSLITFTPQTLIVVVPYMLIGLAVADTDKLRAVLHTTARIGILFGAVSYLLSLFGNQALYYDDMNQAYALCVVTCILISNYQKRDWLFLTLGILAVILAGTRGALIGVLVAVLLRITLLQPKGNKKTVGILCCLLALVLILFTSLPQILLEGISNFFKVFGVKQLRLLDYAQEDMLLHTSGRDNIQGLLLSKAWDNPVMGYGLGADRRFTATGTYAHNIAVELWVAFGFVIGTALLVWMAYYIIKAIISKNLSKQAIVVALFSGVVMKLMFSSSFLYSKELFILLGICCAKVAEKTNENDQENVSEEM